MATIRSYTTVEQSRKLAEFLLIESADCYWEDEISVEFGHGWHSQHVPCWSLAALLGVLPEGTRLLKSATDDAYHCDCPKCNIDEWFDDPIDACYELLLKLYKLKML